MSHFRRAAAIISTWTQYWWRSRRRRPEQKDEDAEDLCRTLKACGLLFIKAGQVMALHLCPEDVLATRLAGLHSDVGGDDAEDPGPLLPPGVTLPSGARPVASGSAAVVYKGEYRGEAVAVKVRRPSAALDYRASLLLLRTAGALSRMLPLWPTADAEGLLALAGRVLGQQVDFRNEVANWRRFYEAYKDHEGVVVPRVHEEICTEDVIVMEWIDGEPVDRCCGEEEAEAVAEALSRFYLRSIAMTGLFHADCHPGNVLLVRGTPPRLAFCDFGLIEALEPEERECVRRLYMHLCNGDATGMTRTLLDGFVYGYDPRAHDLVRRQLEAALAARMRVKPGEVDVIGDLTRTVRCNIKDSDLRLNHKLTTMNLTIVNADRIINRLRPGFDTFSVIRRTVRDALLRGEQL